MQQATGDAAAAFRGNDDITTTDPEIYELMKREKRRQKSCLEMIASENFTSKAVMQALASSFVNKYSEGQIGQRYYGGNEVVDEMEKLCQKRALEAFHLDPELWAVNVQPLSGVPANLAVYTGVVESGGRIMGLDLPDGGHLSHGFFTQTKKISATSIFFESMPYKVDVSTGLIDYDKLAENAKLFRPKLIIAGMSCYSRCIDYKRMRAICDDVDAYLMSDMAHIGGLVAANVTANPFEFSDIVTTTTHKTLRGPRSAIIFCRKGVRRVTAKGDKVMYDLERKINEAVFPGLQGGPHDNAIAAVAVALKEALSPDYVIYQKQVLANAQALCKALQLRGYSIVSGGTDIHLMLLDLRPCKTEGAYAEKVLEECGLAINKNTCPGDKSALRPSGLRIGTPALTSRNLKEHDMEKVADFIDRAIKLTVEAQAATGATTVKDFKAKLDTDVELKKKISSIASEVEKFALSFPMPGYDDV